MNGPSEASSEASQPRRNYVVMKFGGTSVEDAAAIRRLTQLVQRPSALHPVVVVSALAKVTDQLMNAGWAAAAGNLDAAREILQVLRQRHETVASSLAKGDERRRLIREFANDIKAADKMLAAIAAEKAFAPCSQDKLLGIGESLSSKLVQSALQSSGVNAVLVDARECIITDAAHARATPLWDETNARLQAVLWPLLESGQVPVMGGFVGATRDGIPTTLGRGGSDFTASIVGAALQAARIEIWTNVDGILTADPKLCPEARRVPKMSFEEAADLAYFGAKVLHPSSIAPAMRKNIPVWVLNSRNIEGKGTEIVAHSGEECVMKAITAKKGVTVVDVEAVRWLAPELTREIFDVFERHQYSLDLLSASRGSLSLLVTSTEALSAIAEELKGLATVRWESQMALVCLVGEKVRRQPDIASQVFRALSAVDLRMICQGASERNISFLVNESLAEDLVRKLHRLFFQSRFDRHSVASGAQPLCQSAGPWQ